MSFLGNHCFFMELSPELISRCGSFSCEKEKDIENFFKSDFLNYKSQLLGKTYCFITDEEQPQMVCAFTVSNSSIKLNSIPNNKRNRINRKIPHTKRHTQYPAVLIGQLAVFDKFQGLHLGSEILDFIKSWFIDPLNKTGFRFIIVDAINKPKVLDFYQKNGFDFIFSSDEEEMKYLTNTSERTSLLKKLFYKLFSSRKQNIIFKQTRLMYFDLIILKGC